MEKKNVAVVDKETAILQYQISELAKIGKITPVDISPSSLEKVKTPLLSRIKKSKFNAIIEGMTDEDLKLTAYAICFNDEVKKAVKCYHTSVVNYVQIAALVKELNERNIVIDI